MAKGIRYRRNVRKLFGKPDFSIKEYRIVIFIDSCFWHACPIHGNKPENNKDYWDEKLLNNTKRDRVVNEFYISNGWNILRVWEHNFKADFDGSVQEIVS